jgi:hypothetical protein
MKKSILFIYTIISIGLLMSCTEQPSRGKADIIILTDSLSEIYTHNSSEIIQATFQALSSKLMAAMEDGGVPHALRFCNLAAEPVADSMSALYNADIRRIAVKNRNPANYPDEDDLAIYALFENSFMQGNEIGSMLVPVSDHELAYYAPIKLMPQCLVCHGRPESEINSEHYSIITALYPDDKAVGFAAGDLRGLWRIGFYISQE